MQQPHHLPPTPVGMPPHLASPKGIPGLPVALGGTVSVTRPNGLHPSQMMLGPSPLLSMPPTSLAQLPPGLLLPPHAHGRLPQPPISTLASPLTRPHDAIAAMTSQHPAFNGARSNSRGSNAEYEQRSAHVRSKSPPRPDSERGARDGTSPPAAKRARSGSPLQVTEDSDGESQHRNSPGVCEVVDQEIHRSKSTGTV